MTLTLEIVGNKQPGNSGENTRYQIGRSGGTIGRSKDSDVCLPDDSHYVSSHHATIDYHGGRYYLIDVSMNGVYVNDASDPVGSGRPQRLFNGDTLRIGEYVIAVEVDEYLDEMPAASYSHHADSEFVNGGNQLLSERALLDHEATMQVHNLPPRHYGEALTDTVVLGESSAQAGVPPKKKNGATNGRANVAALRAVKSPPGDSKSTVEPKAMPQADSRAPSMDLQAFLRGLGLQPSDLGGVDSTHLMEHAGLALRELVTGSMGVMRTHTAIKSIFGLDDTAKPANEYNPLRSAANPNYALRHLLTNRRSDDAPTASSIREVCNELRRHELAMFCALRDASRKFTQEVHPQRFAAGANARRNPLLGAMGKAKSWDSYTGRFEALTEPQAGQLPKFIGHQFSSAYEMHFKRLKKEEVLDKAIKKGKAARAAE
jgi:type VI secretion system FHA domain protein